MAVQPPSSAISLQESDGQDLVGNSAGRILSAPEFQHLADVPAEAEDHPENAEDCESRLPDHLFILVGCLIILQPVGGA